MVPEVATVLEFDGLCWHASGASPLRLATPAPLRVDQLAISAANGDDTIITRLAQVRASNVLELVFAPQGLRFPTALAWSHVDLYELAATRGSPDTRARRAVLQALDVAALTGPQRLAVEALRRLYGPSIPPRLQGRSHDRQPLQLGWPVLGSDSDLLVAAESAEIRVTILGDTPGDGSRCL